MLLNSHNLAEIMAFIVWSIWFNRNALRVGNPTLPITQIHRDALERLQEFQVAIDLPLHIPTELHRAHWLRPLPQQFKANCDGALFHDINRASLGVVIRNHEGMVMAALAEQVPLPSSVEDVEAMAWRKAVTLAGKLGLQDVVFEGDCEVVFKHLTTADSSWASFGHITDEVRALASNMRTSSFSHIKRSGNAVTDKLAHLAKFSANPQIWIEDVHCNAKNLVIIDKSFLSI